MDNAYHTMGSLDPSRYIFYALCVDLLDSLFDLVLINLSQDQSLGNSFNCTLVDTNSLHLDDVLKVNMNDHTIFFFKTCLQ